MGSWNELDVEGDSWPIKYECERCDELLPGADSVGHGVSGFLGLPTLLETILSGYERAWNFYCEVSDIVWGLFGARFIAFVQKQPNVSSSLNNHRKILKTQGKVFLSSLPSNGAN